MEAKTILIGIIVGIIVGGALVYTLTPRYDPTTIQSQIEGLESSLSNLEIQNSDLQTQLSGLQDQISELQSSLGAKESEITRLGDEVETLTAENAALATENAALKETLDAEDESQPLTYLYNVEIKGDWVIDDYQEINNALVTVDGSIFIEGDGKLVIRNSYLNYSLDYTREHILDVGEWGSDESPGLELYNVTVYNEGGWLYYSFEGRSKIVYDNVRHNDAWTTAGSNAEITVVDSDLGLTLIDNVTLRAENSFLFLELYLWNISGTYTLPTGYVEEQNFVFEKGRNTVVIETSGCNFTDWGVTLSRYSNITFVDTVITIGMNAGDGAEVPEETIVLTGLKAERYDYFVLDYDTHHLELVNSTVTRWYPQVHGGAVLEISDSYLADLQANDGDSVLIVRNCTVQIAIANEEVTYYIYDSTIQWEVTATADSRIFLYNTEVGGTITELDNGQVFIDDEPYGD